MGAIGRSCPIRLVPTYILPTIEIRLLGSFKTERLVCVELNRRTSRLTDRRTDGQADGQTDGQTNGQTNMAGLTCLLKLVKNIYGLWSRLKASD